MERLSKVINNLKQPENAFASIIILGLGVSSGIILKKQIKKVLSKFGMLSGGRFGSINSAEAGARFKAPLKKGKHPIQLHSSGTPNGQKVTILLEELGVKYDAFTISIIDNQDQFSSGFVEINPNSKIPALIDYTEDQENGRRVYESGSILFHLADKYNKFIPQDPKLRTECLNLLFMQMGSAPYFGQYGHFNNFAPQGFWQDHSYAYDRYAKETQRIISVLNNILSDGRKYLVGEEYTIADIAWYPWLICIEVIYKSWDQLNLNRFTYVVQWINLIKQRPAVKKGMIINQPWKQNSIGDYSSP